MEVATIYKQFHFELLGYVQRKIRSREDAEDVLQNVFIKISANVGGLTDEIKLKSWLFTVTRNAIIDYYRANASNKRIAVNEEIDDDTEEVHDPDPTKGLEQCVSTMIALLPEEYRQIIIDAEIKGVKQKDLAARYHMAYPSMRSRVQRGSERLKQLFYNCCHIETDRRGNVIDAQGKTNCEGPCKPCSPATEQN
jgi:RNA polymerase sigma-70 factor (ECF subfamily)